MHTTVMLMLLLLALMPFTGAPPEPRPNQGTAEPRRPRRARSAAKRQNDHKPEDG